jgi:ATP-dependent DNA helicase RecQ
VGEKVLKQGHDELSAYGRGKEVSAATWNEISRELLRIGYLERNEHKALFITKEGRDFAMGDTEATVTIEKVDRASGKSAVNDGSYDEALFERLRAVRKRIADEQGKPAFTVLSDAALKGMARDYPEDDDRFLRVSGVGQSKLEKYGEAFMREIREHVKAAGKRELSEPTGEPSAVALGGSEYVSLEMFRAGKSVDAIAMERGIKSNTVFGHLLRCMQSGENLDVGRFLTTDQLGEIARAAEKYGWNNLTGIYEGLGEKYEYNLLRVARLASRRPFDTSG